MRIHNIRLGFATNSSSSHSLIFLPDGVGSDSVEAPFEFGWDFFTLRSRELKSNYLAQQVYHNIHRQVRNNRIAYLVTKDLTGVDLATDGYVDHQSVWDLPFDWQGTNLDYEFIRDLRAYLMQPNLAVLGGNDNTVEGEEHPLISKGVCADLPLERDHDQKMVAKKDGKTWILYNRKTGAKIRFSFDKDAPAYIKAVTPELVDLCITKWCDKGCRFCYQDSTPKGQHADERVLDRLVYVLKDLNVFEVAIGGGEPTAHPRFDNLLHTLRYYGVVPNFTTRSTAWMKDDQRRESILKECGQFAFSVGCGYDIIQLYDTMIKYNVPVERCNLHVILGVSSDYELQSLFRTARALDFRITLLGFKNIGRGKKVKPVQNKKWIKAAKEAGFYTLSIDTAVANQYGEDLKKAEIDPVLYTQHEGKFSMYIDAVDKKMGPSSFCPQNEMIDLPDENTGEAIQKVFRKW